MTTRPAEEWTKSHEGNHTMLDSPTQKLTRPTSTSTTSRDVLGDYHQGVTRRGVSRALLAAVGIGFALATTAVQAAPPRHRNRIVHLERLDEGLRLAAPAATRLRRVAGAR
ncbi:MAG: hypothetical protein M5U09_11220 [Gammaproteobacteria bacterium]|nr:hypothetical protein [Gammaproteobacteria bacterium]